MQLAEVLTAVRFEQSGVSTRDDNILPLHVENITFVQRDQTLLENISFRLDNKHTTIILGPNGAGKSLLLRICHGLLEPNRGTVRWHGFPAVDVQLKQTMVLQRPVLLRRSVAANIDYALRLRDIAKVERQSAIHSVLELTGLAPLARRNARVLSGGEQQRLALARAWALKPQVLFLDEPTANLDPTATRQVEDIIGLIQRQGTKIVMTTHDLGQARRLADDILFLNHGRLLEQAAAERFFDQPQNEDAAAFIRGELLW